MKSIRETLGECRAFVVRAVFVSSDSLAPRVRLGTFRGKFAIRNFDDPRRPCFRSLQRMKPGSKPLASVLASLHFLEEVKGAGREEGRSRLNGAIF